MRARRKCIADVGIDGTRASIDDKGLYFGKEQQQRESQLRSLTRCRSIAMLDMSRVPRERP